MSNYNFRITSKEVQKRLGYIMMGFFMGYLIEPTRQFIERYIHINPFVFGILGVILTFYYFDLG